MTIMEKITPVLESISLFGGLNKEQIEKMVKRAEVVSAPTGSILFQEGGRAERIHIIVSGKVKTVHNYPENPYEIRELGAGESLGEASLIGVQPHSSTGIVTEEATLLLLNRKMLSELQREESEIFSQFIFNIARELARRVRRYSLYVNSL